MIFNSSRELPGDLEELVLDLGPPGPERSLLEVSRLRLLTEMSKRRAPGGRFSTVVESLSWSDSQLELKTEKQQLGVQNQERNFQLGVKIK